MTSRISFSKLFNNSMKERLWGLLLACVLFFFCLPVAALWYISFLNSEYSIYAGTNIIYLLFRHTIVGSGNGFAFMVICIMAIYMGLNGFSYLFSKPKADLYHSIPVKRTQLFCSNYLSGIVAFVVPYIVFTLFAVIVGAVNNLLKLSDAAVIVQTLAANILGFLLIYTASIVVIMITANRPVSCMGIFVVCLYGIIFYELITFYKSFFYATYSDMAPTDLPYCLSPFSFAMELREMGGMHYLSGLDIKVVAAAVVVTAAMIALAVFLYNKRPLEKAGGALSFTCLRPVIEIVLLVPASLGGAFMFASFTGNTALWRVNAESQSSIYGWFFFGMIAAIIIGHFIIQAIYYMDFRALFKNLLNPAIALVISMLICGCFMFDATGYDSYLPGADVEAVAITGYSLQSRQEYYDFDALVNENGGYDYWVDAQAKRIDSMNITDRDKFMAFSKAALSQTEKYKQAAAAMSEDELYENNTWDEIHVCYKKKSGSVVYRKYYVCLAEMLDEYNEIYCSKEYKDAVFPILSDDNFRYMDDVLMVSDYIGSRTVGKLSDNDARELLNAYRQELYAQDAYDTADSVPVARIYMEHKVHNTMDDYENSYEYAIGYVYPSFTKTISLLNNMGMDVYRYKDIDNIASIEVTDYSYDEYSAKGMDESFVEYTDKADIEAVMEEAVGTDFIWVDSSFHDAEDSEMIVNYINAEQGDSKTVYMRKEKS